MHDLIGRAVLAALLALVALFALASAAVLVRVIAWGFGL